MLESYYSGSSPWPLVFWGIPKTPVWCWFGPIRGGSRSANTVSENSTIQNFFTFFLTNADFSKRERCLFDIGGCGLLRRFARRHRACVSPLSCLVINAPPSVFGGNVSWNDFISLSLALMNYNEGQHAQVNLLRGQNLKVTADPGGGALGTGLLTGCEKSELL